VQGYVPVGFEGAAKNRTPERKLAPYKAAIILRNVPPVITIPDMDPTLLDILHREWQVIKSALYSFVISVLALAGILWGLFKLLYRGRLEGGRPAAKATASIKDSANVTQHFHLGTNASIKTAGSSPKPKKIPKPQIVLRNPQLAKLMFDPREGSWNIGEFGTPGIILPIYHDPLVSDAGAEVTFIRAHMKFTSKSLNRETIVQSGCWLGNQFNWEDFPTGALKYVLLCLFTPDLQAITVENIRDTSSHWGYRDDPRDGLTPYALAMDDYEVEICLLGGSDGRFKQVELIDLPKAELDRARASGNS